MVSARLVRSEEEHCSRKLAKVRQWGRTVPSGNIISSKTPGVGR
jgi:hypothetical protein